jgi:PAS domain S-box-containing protein
MEPWVFPALLAAVAALGVLLVVLRVSRRRDAPTSVAPPAPLDRAGMLNAAYDRSNVGIGFVDAEWQWLDANRKLLSILGYIKSDLTSVPLRFLTHPDDRKREAALMNDLRTGKRSAYSLTKRLLRKTGDYRSVRVHMLRCAETPQIIYQCVIDESASTSHVQTLANALADVQESAAILCDTAGNITAWNKGAERIFGYSAAEAIGTAWTKLHATETRESLARLVAKAAEQGFARSLNTRRCKDESHVVVRSVIVADLMRGGSSEFLEICHKEGAAKIASPAEVRRDTPIPATNVSSPATVGISAAPAAVAPDDEVTFELEPVRDDDPSPDAELAALRKAHPVDDVSGDWPLEWDVSDEGLALPADMIPAPIDVQSILTEVANPAPLVARANAKKPTYHEASCASAQNIPRDQRIYFLSAAEAEQQKFRPCGKCLAAVLVQ